MGGAAVDTQDVAGHELRVSWRTMKNICWALIGLGALAFLVGTFTAFTGQSYLLAPQGYWRGAVGFVVFAIALRLMDDPRR
jgi:hypothetical protein